MPPPYTTNIRHVSIMIIEVIETEMLVLLKNVQKARRDVLLNNGLLFDVKPEGC